MTQGNYIHEEEKALEKLKHILLNKDRVELEELRSKVGNQNMLLEKERAALEELRSILGNQDSLLKKDKAELEELRSILGNQDGLLKKDKAELEELRSILGSQDGLLKKDRTELEELQSKWASQDDLLQKGRAELEELRSTIDTQEKLSEKVRPIIVSHFDFLKENFASDYEEIVNTLIDKKLKKSEQELLDLIYPSLGKMISKFVSLQMANLKESIESSVKSKFSVGRSIKSMFTGVKESELIIRDAVTSSIEEVYVIQRDSGLLISSASKEESMDKDVIAGMLTAIKSFVEDAFNKDAQDLERIEYGNYKIIIRSYYSFYIAIAVSGALSSREQLLLGEKIDLFAEHKMKLFKGKFDSSSKEIALHLEKSFINE